MVVRTKNGRPVARERLRVNHPPTCTAKRWATCSLATSEDGPTLGIANVASMGFVLILLLSAVNPAFAQTTRVNAGAATGADFTKRVNDYLKLHQQAQSGLATAKGTASAAKLTEYRHELAAKIRNLRPQAKQGDIFTPEIAALFRRLISASMKGPDGAKISKSYRRAEPIHGVRLEVNQAYPDGLPLQSMPPSLLANLPRLPKEVEYRFVDHELVLRDIAANLVIDTIPDIVNPEKQ